MFFSENLVFNEGWGGTVGNTSDSVSVSCEFEPLPKTPNGSFSKKLYPLCLVLVGSRKGFEHDLEKQNLTETEIYKYE